MRIAVVGVGYVGLVTGTCLAEIGHDVECVDIDEGKIAALASGRSPIFETGLSELLGRGLESRRLSFSTDLESAVSKADAVFIAVGTPAEDGTGKADLRAVEAVARNIASNVAREAVVVVKSTVPVGTGDRLQEIVHEVNPYVDISVVSNPEFLREGVAVADFMKPDRIVVGSNDVRSRELLEELYKPLKPEPAMLFVSRRTAEVIKYAANSFLALKISFINEIANLCEATGAEVDDVARGIGLDPRIGSEFLSAGPGYGGSCFPKDTRALVQIGAEYGVPLQLVEATIAFNEKRRADLARRVVLSMGGTVAGKTIGVLGLTFKPDTDDLRESPALDLVAGLQAAGAALRCYDPQGMKHAATLFPQATFAADAYEAARGAQALVIVTEWSEFKTLDLVRIRSLMDGHVIFDLRRVVNAEVASAHGFTYHGVGRKSISPHAVRDFAAERIARLANV